MKTKYSDITKIKKQKLREVELELIDIQNRKRKLELQIDEVDKKIKEIKVPESGTMADLKYSHQELELMMREKERLQERLMVRIRQIEGLEVLYKESNIDYEKILYLHKEEIKKEQQKLEKLESKELDEIANILFVNQRESL